VDVLEVSHNTLALVGLVSVRRDWPSRMRRAGILQRVEAVGAGLAAGRATRRRELSAGDVPSAAGRTRRR
jgi:hypothetical protein